MTQSINATTWPAIDPEEKVTATANFAPSLSYGDALQSVVITVQLVQGADGSPAAVLDGTSLIKGARVFQRLQGRVAGASYLIKFKATTVNGDVLVIRRILPVVEQW